MVWAMTTKSYRPFENLKELSTSRGMILNGLKHGGDLIRFVFLKQISLASTGSQRGCGKGPGEHGWMDQVMTEELDKLCWETELTGLWE